MENLRFFAVEYYKNWIDTPLDFQHGVSHSDIAERLPLKNFRILNPRFREIEQTGEYYRITEQCKNGKAFIFEIKNRV